MYYNVSKRTVLTYANKIGHPFIKKPLLSEEQEKEITSRYYSDSGSKLAKEYGVSYSKIQQVWINNGMYGKIKRQYKINENCFKKLDAKKAYIIGFIASDGCLYETKGDKQNILRICIKKNDREVLELFREIMETDKPILPSRDKYVFLEISSNEIVNDLIKIGLSYRKTYENTIVNINKELMPHFIRGYLDGDGSIAYKDKTGDVNISISGYEYNMNKIKDFLMGYNIFSSFVEDKRKYTQTNTGKFGGLVITNKISKYAFLKLIYSNCEKYYLKRKYDNAHKFMEQIENSNKIMDKQILIYYNYAVCKECG